MLRATLYAKLGLLFVLLLVACGVFLRLFAGPVSLRDYAGRVEAGLASRLGPGWSVSLDDASVELNDGKPAVRAAGLQIRNPSGLPVVRAPYAIVRLDPFSLVTGAITPREIELRDLELRALIAADGSLSFVAGPDVPSASSPDPASPVVPPPAQPATSPVAQAVASLFAPVVERSGPIGALDRAAISGARLTLVGDDGRERVAFRRVDAVFDHDEAGERRVDIRLDGPRGSWRVGGLVRERGTRQEADLEWSDVPVDDLLLLAGLSGLPTGSDLKLTARVAAALEGGRLDTLGGSFVTSAGAVTRAGQSPVRIDRISGAAAWNDGARRLDLSSLRIASGPTLVTVDGQLTPEPAGAWRLALSGRDAVVEAATAAEPPFKVDTIEADMVLADRVIRLDRLALKGEALDVALSASTAPSGDGVGLKATVEARNSRLRSVLRLWPDNINPELRTYLTQNLKGGVIDDLLIAVDFDQTDFKAAMTGRPISDASLKMRYVLSDVRLGVLPGLPDLRRIKVVGEASGMRIAVSAPSAGIDMPDGRRLAFLDGTYLQTDRPGQETIAQIDFRLDGPVDALAAFLRSPGLKHTGFDIDPATLKGRGELKVSLPLAIHNIPPPQDLPLAVSGTLTDVTADRIMGKERIEAGRFAVAYAGGAFTLKGDARIGGSPATVDLRQPRGAPGEALVTLTLDEAARARRSLPAAPQLSGPVAVKVAVPLGAGPKAVTRVEADLSRAIVDGLLPGWSKPAGRPGRLSFVSETDGDLRDVVLEAGPVQARGTASFKDGALEKADLATLKLSPGDEMRAQVERAGGAYHVSLRGNVGDARPVMKWMTDAPRGGGKGRSADAKDPPDVDLDLALSILTGNNDEVLTGVTARLSARKGDLRALHLKGQFRAAPLDVRLNGREGGAPSVTVETADAGATLRFLDLYKRMLGGRMRLQATVGDTQTGTIAIDEFGLRNEPALARIAAQHVDMAEDKLGTPLPKLDGDVVQFTKLTAGFKRSASRVDYRDVVIYGPQVGFSLNGFVDYGRDRLDVVGTFVPAYGLNNALSYVPIVGLLLTGDKNEGLFSVDFRVAGATSAPTLTVNPLTVVTPGILRKLFGWMLQTDGGPATTSSPR